MQAQQKERVAAMQKVASALIKYEEDFTIKGLLTDEPRIVHKDMDIVFYAYGLCVARHKETKEPTVFKYTQLNAFLKVLAVKHEIIPKKAIEFDIPESQIAK